jgi:hypothetical protein
MVERDQLPTGDGSDQTKTAETEQTTEERLIDCLADEYKILQDKIDKIGGFRFTIKGWSITVILGALFAVSATGSLPRLPWLLSLLVFIGLFFLVEKRQTDLSYHFGQRAMSIEVVLSRILRQSSTGGAKNDFVLLHFVPGIGHHLGRLHQRRRNTGPRSKLRSFRDADLYFYLIQAAIVLVVVLTYGNSQSRRASTQVLTINTASTSPTSGDRAAPTSQGDEPTAPGGDKTAKDNSRRAGGSKTVAVPSKKADETSGATEKQKSN